MAIINNPWTVRIGGGLVIIVLLWVLKRINDNSETNKIINFLEKSKENTEYAFRSTEAISSSVGISKKRIEVLCSCSKKTKRNEKEKESWKLIK